MTKVTKQELNKLAELGCMYLEKREIIALNEQIEDVLSYAERVNEIAQDVDLSLTKNANVFREDVIDTTLSKVLMTEAPLTEENYFVVPMVIEK